MRKIIFMLSEFEYIWNAKLSVLYKFTVMPKISEKAGMMPASPIRKLVPYAEAAKRRGVKVYHLNIGQPDIHTPEIALNAVKNMDLKVIEYTIPPGTSHTAVNWLKVTGRSALTLTILRSLLPRAAPRLSSSHS